MGRGATRMSSAADDVDNGGDGDESVCVGDGVGRDGGASVCMGDV